MWIDDHNVRSCLLELCNEESAGVRSGQSTKGSDLTYTIYLILSCPEYYPPPRAPIPAMSRHCHCHFLRAPLSVTPGTLPRRYCAVARVGIVLNDAMQITLKRHRVTLLPGMTTMSSTVLVMLVMRPHALCYRAIAPDSDGDFAAALLVGSGSAPGCTEGHPKEFRGARAWAYGNVEGGGTARGRDDNYAAMGPYWSVRDSRLIANPRSQESRKRFITSESWNGRTVLLPRRELYRVRSYVVDRRRVSLIRAHSREHITAGQVHRREA